MKLTNTQFSIRLLTKRQCILPKLLSYRWLSLIPCTGPRSKNWSSVTQREQMTIALSLLSVDTRCHGHLTNPSSTAPSQSCTTPPMISLAFCARAKGRAHSMLRKCFIWIIWQGIVFVHYEWASFDYSVLTSIGKCSPGRLQLDVSRSFSLAGSFDVWGSFMNLAQQKLDRNFEWCCMFKDLQI